ncbi:RNA polymerase sigma factor [Isoptericola sp. NEAU-Y5]|uniref:RNA polymerase sigma factor n=1 Tax=Isoptericola luteus TaxID=2879484 RepID=A0ABS7ZBV9_9MICO|nr:RNA polymerase sigma factor [Isoptericola sp. NEAU-Y5]MCA5892517.1 RNA polymerase sigma factor [Isoptericola sp. NEAU-Y5]
MIDDEVERLAAAAAAGRPAALDALLARVRPDVLRICARFLPCAEDAEEACQDTLLALSRSIESFEGRSAFRTWLYGVAANRSRSTYRRLRRRSELEGSGPPPEHPDPRRTSVVAGTRVDLLDGLARLGADRAEAVALRDVVGLSYGEIAAVLAVPEGTAKSRVHEGRRRLRARMTVTE